MASFLSLQAIIKERVIVKCLGLAVVFSFALYGWIVISTIVLGPFIDPWY